MKIALIGYGKMGKAIEAIAVAKGHEISHIIDQDSQHLLEKENLQSADVAIEFTTPETAFSRCMRHYRLAGASARSNRGMPRKTPGIFICEQLQHRRKHLL
jgi:4-hydroxy-tetrahydrodipicolinate reductase